MFFRFTLETTTYFYFSKSIGALEQSHETGVAGKEMEFAEAFTVAQGYLAQRGRLGDLHWLIGGPRFWRACRTVDNFVDSMIKLRMDAKGSIDSNYVSLDLYCSRQTTSSFCAPKFSTSCWLDGIPRHAVSHGHCKLYLIWKYFSLDSYQPFLLNGEEAEKT